MSFQPRLLLIAAVFMFAVASQSQSNSSTQERGPLGRAYDYLTSFLQGTREAGEVNPKPCTNCETNNRSTTSTPRTPHPELDRSIAWMKGFLKCDNFAYLESQRENLIRAEKVYGVPATVVACLIATESAWDINADQLNKYGGHFNGSFKGLTQGNTTSFLDVQNMISRNPKYRDQWNTFNAGISPQILKSETMHVPQGIIFSCPITRCGGAASARDKERIARASIGFVSTYLQHSMQVAENYITDTKSLGAKALAAFQKSKTTRYLAGAVGYNAGPSTIDEYLPPAAYSQEYSDWKFNLRVRRGNVAKLGEVTQYLGWISSCMSGNPRNQPPNRTVLLQDKSCFPDTKPATLRRLLSATRTPRATCNTDPAPSCSGPNRVPTAVLTPAQIDAQKKRCSSDNFPEEVMLCPK